MLNVCLCECGKVRVSMAYNARERMSVLDNDFPEFVCSVLDEYEGSDVSECEDENEPDHNSQHDTES